LSYFSKRTLISEKIELLVAVDRKDWFFVNPTIAPKTRITNAGI
jgi:hypothetical protein